MAIVAIASTSITPHKGVSGYSTLRDAAELTTSYVATDEFPCAQFDVVVFDLDFTIGLLTSLEVKYQYSTDGGTTWRDIYVLGAATAGVAVASVRVDQFTATAAGAAPPLSTIGYELVRAMVKGTGTVTSSSLTVAAAGGKISRATL